MTQLALAILTLGVFMVGIGHERATMPRNTTQWRTLVTQIPPSPLPVPSPTYVDSPNNDLMAIALATGAKVARAHGVTPPPMIEACSASDNPHDHWYGLYRPAYRSIYLCARDMERSPDPSALMRYIATHETFHYIDHAKNPLFKFQSRHKAETSADCQAAKDLLNRQDIGALIAAEAVATSLPDYQDGQSCLRNALSQVLN